MVQFGFLRQAFESGVLLPSERFNFFGTLKKIAEDQELRENYDVWLKDKLRRNIEFLSYIKDDPSCYWMFQAIYRFFEFDELCVDSKLSEGIYEKVDVEKLRIESGVENMRLFISSSTKEIICSGFNGMDFDCFREVVNCFDIDLNKLTFSNCTFDLDKLSEIKGLFNGWIDTLEVRAHRGENFLDNRVVVPGRFDFLVGSTLSSFETHCVLLNELDGRSIGEFISKGPNIESLSVKFGVIDGVGFAANLITSSGEVPKLKSFEVKDSNFDDTALRMCVDSGFLDKCKRLSLTGCYDLSVDSIAYMQSQIDLNDIEIDYVMKNRMRSLYNVQ